MIIHDNLIVNYDSVKPDLVERFREVSDDLEFHVFGVTDVVGPIHPSDYMTWERVEPNVREIKIRDGWTIKNPFVYADLSYAGRLGSNNEEHLLFMPREGCGEMGMTDLAFVDVSKYGLRFSGKSIMVTQKRAQFEKRPIVVSFFSEYVDLEHLKQ